MYLDACLVIQNAAFFAHVIFLLKSKNNPSSSSFAAEPCTSLPPVMLWDSQLLHPSPQHLDSKTELQHCLQETQHCIKSAALEFWHFFCHQVRFVILGKSTKFSGLQFYNLIWNDNTPKVWIIPFQIRAFQISKQTNTPPPTYVVVRSSEGI